MDCETFISLALQLSGLIMSSIFGLLALVITLIKL